MSDEPTKTDSAHGDRATAIAERAFAKLLRILRGPAPEEMRVVREPVACSNCGCAWERLDGPTDPERARRNPPPLCDLVGHPVVMIRQRVVTTWPVLWVLCQGCGEIRYHALQRLCPELTAEAKALLDAALAGAAPP